MREKLLEDINIELSKRFDKETREAALQCVITAMRNYEISERMTDLTVRHEALNEDILKRYAVCMSIEGIAESSITAYLYTLKKLAETIPKPFTEMRADDIYFFLGHLKMRGCKNSYMESQRANLSSFFVWLHGQGFTDKVITEKVKTIKVEEEIRPPFSPVEIDRMRFACKRPIDRAVIELFLSSGIRCEELCNLKVFDLDCDKRTVSVKRGKGGKDRVTFMSDVAVDHIRKYTSKRKTESAYLFASERSKGAYSKRGIETLVERIGKRAGVEHVHPHRFRRTFATNLFQKGMDVASISKLMGHSNVETTMRYIYVANEQLERDYRRYAA